MSATTAGAVTPVKKAAPSRPAKPSSKKRKQPENDESSPPVEGLNAKKPHLMENVAAEVPLEVAAFFQARFNGHLPATNDVLTLLPSPLKCDTLMTFMSSTLTTPFESISGTHYTLSEICSMFLDAFIVSAFGVLVCFNPTEAGARHTFKFVDNLAQFIDITSHLRTGLVRTLLYYRSATVSPNPQQRFTDTYRHTREQVLNRMLLRTTTSKVEQSIYKLMKQCQHWTWWSNVYPTELVFIVAKLLYGCTETVEDEVILATTVKPILDAVFSALPLRTTEEYHKQVHQESVSHVSATLNIALNRATQHPLASQLIINPLQSIQYTNTDQMDNRIHVLMSMDHSIFDGAPVHIIQQCIKTGAFTAASCPQLGHTETAKSMFRTASAEPANLDTLSLSIQIPIGLLIMLSFYNCSSITRLWHNLMLIHIHNILHPDVSITKWTEALQKRGSEWYRVVMAHQNILQTFMNMNLSTIGAVFDRSYKLALNIASGVVDPNDWIISFFTVLAKRPQTEWTWQPISLVGDHPNRFHAYIQAALLARADAAPPLLEEMWAISNERRLLATSAAESINFRTYNWSIVYQSEQEELQLLWSKAPWWKTIEAPVACSNGLNLSGAILHRMEVDKNVRMAQSTTVVRSDQFGKKYWYKYSVPTSAAVAAELNTLCRDTPRSPYVQRPQKIYMTAEHEQCLLAWFKPVLLALFGGERHLNLQLFSPKKTLDDLVADSAHDSMLVGFFQMCLQRFYNYSRDDVYLDMSLYYAVSPEFLSPLMIQHLVHMANTCLFESTSSFRVTDVTAVQHDKSLAISKTTKTVQIFAMNAPYIPSNSMALDTWIYSSRPAVMSSDYDFTAPDKLLIVMKTGEWYILRLHSMYDLTFATDMLYRSSSGPSSAPNHHGSTYGSLSTLLAGAQFIVRTTFM